MTRQINPFSIGVVCLALAAAWVGYKTRGSDCDHALETIAVEASRLKIDGDLADSPAVICDHVSVITTSDVDLIKSACKTIFNTRECR